MQGSPRIDELRQKFHENPRRYFAPLANEYRKAGDPEQAIAICRAHLAQQPGHMSGHVVYGQALFDARRIDESRTVFEKALSLDPDNPIVLRRLGDIARQRGDATEAKHWYGRALDTDPHDTEVAAYIAELTEPLNDSTAEVASVSPEVERDADPPAEPVREPVAESVEPLDEDDSPYRDDTVVPGIDDVAASLPTADVIPIVPPQDEVAWRNTPAQEDSPFVTRTMADLYAKQGFREAALDVYRQLALSNPDDEAIVARIGELSVDSTAKVEAEIPRTEALPDIEADLLSWGDLASDAIDSPTSEEPSAGSAEATDEPDALLSDDTHFTEKDLSGGDSWDTDMWGAGFSTEESVPIEFDSKDVPAPADASPGEGAAEASGEATPDETTPVTEAASPAEDVVEAAPAEDEEAVGGGEDDAHLVAYSPQPPDVSELAHYKPQGPTIREFFSAIASRRPPSEQVAQSFTARSAVPMPASASRALPGTPAALPSGVEAAATAFEGNAFPPAADAFSGLFPQSNVSEEDSRAAFALSGAVSGSGPGAPQPLEPPPRAPVESQASPSSEHGQESEEDIRRFREWLDGLAGT